jgi:hypothetical protein
MKTLIAVLIFCLVGCTQVHVKPVPIQENLLQECTKDTPIPENGTGGEVLKTLDEWQAIYNECRAGKHALIKAVRKT